MFPQLARSVVRPILPALLFCVVGFNDTFCFIRIFPLRFFGLPIQYLLLLGLAVFVHIVEVAEVEPALSMMYFYVETYNKVFVPQALATELHPQENRYYISQRLAVKVKLKNNDSELKPATAFSCLAGHQKKEFKN